MLTSRINLPIPGGWGKDSKDSKDQDPVAAGVVDKAGNVVDDAGKPVAKITEGQPEGLTGNVVTATGEIVSSAGETVGKAVPLGGEESEEKEQQGGGGLGLKGVTDTVGGAVNTVGKAQPLTGQLTKGLGLGGGSEASAPKDASEVDGAKSDAVDTAEEQQPIKLQDDEVAPEESVSVAQDNAGGDDSLNVIDNPEEMEIKDSSTQVDKAEENVPDDTPAGDVKSQAPEDAPVDEVKPQVPEDTPAEGDVNSEIPEDKPADAPTEIGGEQVPKDDVPALNEDGEAKTEAGETPALNEDGEAKTEAGETPAEAEGEEEVEKMDFSILKGCKVNKAGNVVNDKSQAVGRIVEGTLKQLVGRKTDENGEIWNDSGKVIGKAEPIPEKDRDEFKEPAPFEDFPDATVASDGKVMFNGEAIGIVVEGDAKALKGKKVDDDGDILDRAGNKLGRAERWEPDEPEPEPEPEVVDKSILAGKRVNKLGNVVDSSGTIYGRLVEGDAKRLAGRMCDKEGNVRSESGDVIGKAELVPEGEREGVKEGPFSELQGCTVAKDGTVVTPSGDIVGRLVKGDPKTLYGRGVDEDGDVLDKNGNSLGKAERWEPEAAPEKEKGPMFGRKVNREGNVVDADGNLIGKLTSGELSICAGKEIDADGDVVDSKGTTVGHVSLLADIPAPAAPTEPEETVEDKEKREAAEQDKKLAKQMASTLTQCLDKIKPICKMITQKIEKADATPKDDLDEEKLVSDVKPLIEEGSRILQEANGVIRGLDPDGHIQANAKHKTASREASPEEYHLADVLKEITGTVTECIDNAKKKIEDMPHAKKELNPLWGLMTEPLFQILAAVGLLLNGVLELVGRLLSGLGLGGLVNNILGGLGISNVLKSLGVGNVVGALTGKNQDKKK